MRRGLGGFSLHVSSAGSPGCWPTQRCGFQATRTAARTDHHIASAPLGEGVIDRDRPPGRVFLSLSLSLAIKDIPWETLGPRAPQKAIRRTKKEVVRSKRGMKEFGVVVCSAAGSWNGTPMIKVHSTLFTRITKNKPHHHPFVLFACVRGRQTIERGKGSAASSGGSK